MGIIASNPPLGSSVSRQVRHTIISIYIPHTTTRWQRKYSCTIPELTFPYHSIVSTRKNLVGCIATSTIAGPLHHCGDPFATTVAFGLRNLEHSPAYSTDLLIDNNFQPSTQIAALTVSPWTTNILTMILLSLGVIGGCTNEEWTEPLPWLRVVAFSQVFALSSSEITSGLT